MVLVIFINTDLLRRLLYTWIHRCVRYSVNRIITQSLGNFRPQSVVLGRVECREPLARSHKGGLTSTDGPIQIMGSQTWV